MEKYEFLKTLEGKKNRIGYNFFQRVSLSYPEKLISKKNGSHKFNKQIIDETISQMKERERTSFKAEIACNIRINSVRKNLPETYHISKNYLDLINKNWVTQNENVFSKSDLARLPYVDDSQISYLSISFATHDPQELRIELSSFSRFLNDLALASEIKGLHTDDSFESNVDWEWLHSYWKEDEVKLRKQFGDRDYENTIKLYKKHMQDSFWRGNMVGVSEIYHILGYKGRIDKYKYSEYSEVVDKVKRSNESLAAFALRTILNSRFSISLPDPCVTNFNLGAISKLNEFKSKILKNRDFDIPVGVQVLYRPFNISPKKDLDNISREILKCFKNCFKNPGFDLFEDNFPQSYKNATPCYEVIRLPYDKKEPGFLILRIFSLYLDRRRTLWDEISTIGFRS